MKKARNYIGKIKAVLIVSITSTIVMLMSFSFTGSEASYTERPIAKDSVTSVKAFMEVYKVLQSPRCMNCHPAGDVPLTGDQHQPHNMNPQRGKDGRGVSAMKCTNCHQPTNIAGLNKPPGHPNWHLPPANMKMVFEDRTAQQLAKQLVNPKTNGNKTLQQLIAHADDGLVKAGWNPGEGRTVPPLTHAEFKKFWIQWIQTGAYAPSEK